jgi:hypothetical protein
MGIRVGRQHREDLMEPTAITIQPQIPHRQRSGVPSTLGWRRIQRTRRLLLLLPWPGLVWQWMLAQSADDLFSAFLAATGAFLIFFDAFRPQRLYRYLLSTLVVLGFGLTLQLGPLLFTAFEGNSLTFNLAVPVVTFGHGFLSSLVAIGAHWFYRNVRAFAQGRDKIHKLLIRLNIFVPLDFKEVALMGFLGLTAFVVEPLAATQAQADNYLFKLIEGFKFLAAIPAAYILQLILQYNGKHLQPLRRVRIHYAWFFYLIFNILLVSVGLLRNSRITFVNPLSCLVLGLAIIWLFGAIRVRATSLIAFGFAILVALPLITDLATAMVMTRAEKSSFTPLELVEQTWRKMEDRPAIESFRRRAELLSLESDLSEQYVSNILLARFANARFPDNSLEQESRLASSEREEMLLFHWDRFISIFPTPLIYFFGISERIKVEARSISFGDKLNFLATQRSYILGWLRTGHFFGTGMAAFGFFYLLLLFSSLILLFPLVDSHVLIGSQAFDKPPILSAVAITQLLYWFIISNSESIIDLLSYSTRFFLEPIALFTLARWIAKPFKHL